jgi:hypothetical protein
LEFGVKALAFSWRFTTVFALLLLPCGGAGQAPSRETDTATDQIVARMVEANARRAIDLRSYTGKRVYKFQYRGVPVDKDARMDVTTRYTAPGVKQFEIISQSGSKIIVNRVLKRLLDSERDASLPQNQAAVAIGPENYRFNLLGQIEGQHGNCYRIHVEPIHPSKYLFRGEIWVNANDFAVERIDAELAKNPALWIIRKTHIQSSYEKIGEFWVPAFNRSQSTITLGGTATLTIQYTDYVVTPQDGASGR